MTTCPIDGAGGSRRRAIGGAVYLRRGGRDHPHNVEGFDLWQWRGGEMKRPSSRRDTMPNQAAAACAVSAQLSASTREETPAAARRHARMAYIDIGRSAAIILIETPRASMT